jgi:hypothetical protein
MSIKDNDGNEILQLSWIWSASFKLLLLLVPFVAITLFSWGTWVTLTLFDHSAEIRILQDRSGRNGGGNISGASINVGKADGKVAESARQYLTVKEVAERESAAERTVISWIENGRIEPAPIKAGKEWQISAEYRIPPQVAAEGGSHPDDPEFATP